MCHILLLGMTLSGKTYKGKALARDYKRNGIGVLVLDPLRDPEWSADFITDDPAKFLEVFWNSRGCMAFMDEGGESVGRYDTTMQKTATRGRHHGHVCHYLAQKATQLAPVVRDQCTRLFAFCQSYKDGKILSDEWNRPELETVNTLKQGEYIYAVKMGDIQTNRRQEDASITNRGRTSGDAARSDPKPRRQQKGVRHASETSEAGQTGSGNPGSGVMQVADS